MYRIRNFSLLVFYTLLFSSALYATEIKIKMRGEVFTIDERLLKRHPESRLTQMLMDAFGNPQQKPDEDGFYTVDANPKYFQHILDYWMYQDADIKKEVDLDLLEKMATYWGAYDFLHFIAGLKKGLNKSEGEFFHTCQVVPKKLQEP